MIVPKYLRQKYYFVVLLVEINQSFEICYFKLPLKRIAKLIKL